MQVEQQMAWNKCAHPFEVLGPKKSAGGTAITAWIPGATKVGVTVLGQEKALMELTAAKGSSLFTGQTSALSDGQIYQLDVENADGKYSYVDPYQFQQQAYHAVHFIDHAPQNLYRQGGAQLIELDGPSGGIAATRFAVYAPNASAVSLIGDFNRWDSRLHPMQKTDLGFWVLVVPGIVAGERYKYHIKDAHGHDLPHKADPLGFHAEQFPSHASRVFDHSQYQWQDEVWMESRKQDKYRSPMSIYEVHLGSWKRPQSKSKKRYLSYRELAEDLIPYVKEMGYTHLELLPVSEYPFDGSWGYQPVGMFAPTSRFGDPDDFKFFVDQCHQQQIGVIIDWVPAHFPEDGHGLARFDGSHVYEYEDPRRGWHPDWNSCIYDFGKDTVRQFLVANALFWLDKFHVDGLRVDAVASMLYLDYSRNEGEWVPNVDGGNENYEAISLLRWMNEEVYRHFPDAVTIAEESTSFPKVSRPVFDGGLGFGFKWNMGWMHDSLHYISKDPAYRCYHHGDITFSMVYAYHENFILPISHDEVVHGKGSMLGKMPGDEWQQAANLRSYAAFMFGHPGKKLNFMGNEIGQAREWNHDGELQWDLLAFDKHQGLQTLYKTLNRLYTSEPALYECDHQPEGFAWIDHENGEQSVLSFVRKDASDSQHLYVVSNFTPVPRPSFRIGVMRPGKYKLVLNTDSQVFWGSEYPVSEVVEAVAKPWNHQPYSIEISIPPLATLYLIHD
ncbi:1,4-alpha-glucan branching protein GlgB [Alteromonas aestuariivivens]|uniref:1,4-alpha-glucan branching enzyme GlgB n=1 Tax=Alteromonas aestuariivivens TaxID=1938339 RepID=A0A3D8M8M1_9ALTE|nr:1,4-alpha-glucan branching protein GlgB [Alteromonas aestuariivivens]RDV26149.1 1,4-alpha-glucan branching protein GlgB [Alteromonas aestuariivivens]